MTKAKKGRDFTEGEIEQMRQLIAAHPKLRRTPLSKLVCEMFHWRSPNGQPKEMSCRVAMLRMQEDDLLELPPPVHRTRKPTPKRTPQGEPPAQTICLLPSQMKQVTLHLVGDKKTSFLWNEYIDRYHYLRYTPLPGAQLRYLVYHEQAVVAALGFGAAAWKAQPRDQFIGWNTEQREKGLHFIVNNARFLILPWVKAKNLATRILSMVLRRLCDDWNQRYSYRPALVETYVEKPRFLGTCYKAGNWIYVGDTQGRGKLDFTHSTKLPQKAIWVYPLDKNFRHRLTHL
jgi:hypothetical protein